MATASDHLTPEDALTQALASVEGHDATKGDRLRAVRILNQLGDRGFDVVPVAGHAGEISPQPARRAA